MAIEQKFGAGNLLKKMLWILALTLAIPVTGYFIGYFVIKDVNKDLVSSEIPSIQVLCDNLHLFSELPPSDQQDLKGACKEYQEIALLKQASIYAGLAPIILLITYIVASRFAGVNRRRIAFIFRPLVFLSIIAISGIILSQGAILIYGVYIAESYFLGMIHSGLLLAVGLGALIAGLKLVSASFSFLKKAEIRVFGTKITEQDAPKFFALVKEIAAKLGANFPQHIIVGLNPSFYVTSANVVLVGNGSGVEKLTGETLYVSAPLMRLMNKSEISSVIGHELAHFRGDDTAYSLKFAPIFSSLETALIAVDTNEEDGASGITKLPALALLSVMHDIFSANEAAISRDRELIADKAGAEVGSGAALIGALAKLSVYSSLWPRTQKNNVQRLKEGKISRNLSKVFIDTAKYDVEHEKLDALLSHILTSSIEHPTDSHPTIERRMEFLNIKREEITREMLVVAECPASSLIENLDNLEESLSTLEHRLMIALGHAKLPENQEDDESNAQGMLLRISYLLAAAMINSDGQVLPKEIEMAEGVGVEIFTVFDAVEFRECVNHPKDNPELDKIFDLAKQLLTEKGCLMVYEYLRAIAKADGQVGPSEQALLDRCVKELSIDTEKLDKVA